MSDFPTPQPLNSFEPDDSFAFEPADEPQPVDDESTPARQENDTAAPASARAGITKAAARRIIEKYLEVDGAPKAQRKILAAALGTRNDTVEISSVIVSSARTNLTAITELTNLAAETNESVANGFVAAFALGKDGSKRVWQLLTELGKVSGPLATKEAVAATKLAEAAGSLTDNDRADLDAVRALARK